MQTEKFQPEGKRIMPETRFIEFPALPLDPRVAIFLSAFGEFFLPMTLKITEYIEDILLFQCKIDFYFIE